MLLESQLDLLRKPGKINSMAESGKHDLVYSRKWFSLDLLKNLKKPHKNAQKVPQKGPLKNTKKTKSP